jgi:hypothetical protein
MSLVASSESIPLDLAARRLLESELKPGESLLWHSAPIARRHWLAALPILFFAIPWTAFAIFWMTMASRGSAVFALFGLPFVGIGCVMLAAPWWAARMARRTAYALTTDRAIILAPSPWGGGVSVRSFSPGELGDVERVQRHDGSGDLILAREWVRGSKGRMREKTTGFIGVPAVQTVQLRIDELARAHRGERGEANDAG